jgi:Tfp pilus assembly protein PilF
VSEYDIARDLWLRRGQVREALDHALKAIELDDENHEAFHLVALLYLDFCARSPAECRLAEAEKAAARALALKKDFREARNTLGVVLIHEKRPRDAISVLKPLSEDILYQTPEKAWGNLGWAYFEAGDLDRAIDALRRSIAAQPLFCVGSFRLALAYERRGELAPALAAYTRALETRSPECAQLQDALLGRARVAERLGQTDSIRADLERCVELSRTTETGKNCRSLLDKLK